MSSQKCEGVEEHEDGGHAEEGIEGGTVSAYEARVEDEVEHEIYAG